MKDEESPGFTVRDRRGRDEGKPKKEEGKAPQTKDTHASASAPSQPKESGLTFSSLVISLSTAAMVYMGMIPDPNTGKKEEDLESARQQIDLLEILEEKTKGNLSPQENQLLTQALYELRMNYLNRTKT